MIEPEIKQHLTDHAKITRFVAEISKLGLSEKDIYGYAVRLFVVDLDVLSDVIRSKHQGHTDQHAPESWWQRLVVSS